MKNLYVSIYCFYSSCSDSEEPQSYPLAGICRLVWLILKEASLKTLYFGKLKGWKEVKYIGRGTGSEINSLWFRSARTKDSIPSTSSSMVNST